MFVIRLPNGNLLVPESATVHDDRLVADAYVEIGPDDEDYDKFAAAALTQEELDERAKQWRKGDEPLHRQFLDFLARGGELLPFHDRSCRTESSGRTVE